MAKCFYHFIYNYIINVKLFTSKKIKKEDILYKYNLFSSSNNIYK